MTITWSKVGGFKLGDMWLPERLVAGVEVDASSWQRIGELADVFAILAKHGPDIGDDAPSIDDLKSDIIAAGWQDARVTMDEIQDRLGT